MSEPIALRILMQSTATPREISGKETFALLFSSTRSRRIGGIAECMVAFLVHCFAGGEELGKGFRGSTGPDCLNREDLLLGCCWQMPRGWVNSCCTAHSPRTGCAISYSLLLCAVEMSHSRRRISSIIG
jgi:hypothetical protein